ncbi:hypothetical protein [Candidatus Oscillochloris fontis]|uniref:hypothetical protein n=1 Tax=Candidatus Oscillochloris fontis TaxID=2496868 RepID=UPI00101D8010|nr:hypothetical protein [Candidatus Oscillochloris fontis]
MQRSSNLIGAYIFISVIASVPLFVIIFPIGFASGEGFFTCTQFFALFTTAKPAQLGGLVISTIRGLIGGSLVGLMVGGFLNGVFKRLFFPRPPKQPKATR